MKINPIIYESNVLHIFTAGQEPDCSGCPGSCTVGVRNIVPVSRDRFFL